MSARWFEDRSSCDEVHRHRVRRVLYAGRSAFQRIEILDLADFGRTLVLDGRIQAAERDEFIYHESLVHPALALHPRPRRVLILGGGEGATAREVLRRRSVRACAMVDLDGAVVAACRRHLSSFHAGAFEDPRLELRTQDARRFLARDPRVWDAIVSDVTEPEPGGPAEALFTVRFFRLLARRLAPGGILAIQAGSASLPEMDAFAGAVRTLRRVFPRVLPYAASIPSFAGLWGFALCGGASLRAAPPARTLAARLRREGLHGLRHYDAEAHAGMFALPRYLREVFEVQQ